MSEIPRGPLIRELTEQERRLIQKYQVLVEKREAETQRALVLFNDAKVMLNDVVLAFNQGKVCVIAEDALFEAPSDG